MTKRITPALLREAAEGIGDINAGYVIDELRRRLQMRETDSYWRDVRNILRAVADAWEGGWMERPVGADGRAVHIGEEVFVDGEGPYEVVGLHIGRCGWDVRFYAGGNGGWNAASVARVTHDRPDSWERVLRDAMALGFRDGGTEADLSDLVGRCRRLAGEVA